MSACAIGLDLGGSLAKLALVNEQGAVLLEETVSVLEAAEPLIILNPIATAIDRLRDRAAERHQQVVALGCGFSGYLDATRTRIEINNIRALDGFALEAWLQQRFGLPVWLDNDACMAAIAETALLPVGDAGRVLVVTVGSGIGVVLVVDGAIVRVMYGVTGDAGHIIVDHAGTERCPVGCRGCLETVASARAIARAGERAARAASSPALAATLLAYGAVTSASVSAAAAGGDVVARRIIDEAGQWLGIGLASWAPIYAPDLILLGGGVAQAGDPWFQAALATMHDHGLPLCVAKMRVRLATLGNRAGVIGAALAARRASKTGGAL